MSAGLIKTGTGVILIKGFALTIGFLLNVVVARQLGIEEAGRYFLSFTVIAIAAVIGRCGVDQVILRFTAANRETKSEESSQSLLLKTFLMALGGSLIVTAFLALSAPLISTHLFGDPAISPVLFWMSIGILPWNMTLLLGEFIKGEESILKSQLVQLVLLNGFTLGLLTFSDASSAITASKCFAASGWISVAVGAAFSAKHFAGVRRHSNGTEFPFSTIRRVAKNLYAFAILGVVIQMSSGVIIGIFRPAADVAQFHACLRLAVLVAAVLASLNSLVAPRFARYHASGNTEALRDLTRKAAIVTTGIAIPMLLLALCFPKVLLSLFGESFLVAAPILGILAVGQFVNAATGSVGFLLNMTGNEDSVRNTTIGATVLQLALCFSLVPLWGGIGAAIANASVNILRNLVLVGFAWKRLGFVPIPGTKKFDQPSPA